MNIPITDDELIPDATLAEQWGVTRRTLARYEAEKDGLPFWMVGGKKYRGRKASGEWLARRMHSPNPRRAA